ncbi:WXG100 family type VII secretion target [Lentzea jiangxiensis]|uniref:WXG100 family type VII secretion target n=1 Tax=Lentzea jiangxiensis TaxID=641025 RepID=A0A1H0X410_9PSEU|nr:WXG100 family type VII secretion target [Lentzea jiangxiensis]SDP97465.1 WXG100 family type VII secretion target [Lentzea jiangxiensis]
MSMPQNFSKQDAAMKAGVVAVDDCLSTCNAVHATVADMRAVLKGKWQGLAGDMYRNAMEGWENDYRQVVGMLRKIRDMLEHSDKKMTGMEQEIAQYVGPSFGDSSTPMSSVGNQVYNGINPK